MAVHGARLDAHLHAAGRLAAPKAPSAPRPPKFQAGGSIGILPPDVTDENPLLGGYYQSFQQMSPEQLQQFSAMAGGSSEMGQLARAALMQKSIMGSVGSPGYQATGGGGVLGNMPNPSAPLASAEQSNAKGAKSGGVIKRAGGGEVPLSMADPWWTREEAGSAGYGLMHSSVPGRTDRIATSPAADSFVVPADVVAGLGEDNTLSGAKLLEIMLHTGPYGTSIPRLPTEGHPVRGGPSPSIPFNPGLQAESRGGVTGRHDQQPIVVAGGEFLVPPDALARLPGAEGSVERGHRIMRALCKLVRAEHIKAIKEMPEPVK